MSMKFRPRFTVRTLAIVVTLVCAYFGAWEATKRYGTTDEHSQLSNLDPWIGDEESPLPFVVSRLETEGITVREFLDINFQDAPPKRCYYVWLLSHAT